MTSARLQRLVKLVPGRRFTRLVVPAVAATLVTGTVVGVAIADNDPEPVPAAAPVKPVTVRIDPADSPYLAARVGTFSRSAKRVTLEEKPEVVDHEWLTAPLNLWPEPKERGKPLAILAEGGQVAVTGAHRNGFAQILHRGLVRWVNADYLAEHKPKPPEPVETPEPEAESSSTESQATSDPTPEPEAAPSESSPVSGGACASGSSMESGIVSRAVALHRAVCAQFPQVSEYGGYRGDGEHSDGHAIDIMVYGDSGTGQAVADWLRAHSGELGLADIIWAQHIWTNQRSSEGWRSMPDRGSATANHYDHVHVRVF